MPTKMTAEKARKLAVWFTSWAETPADENRFLGIVPRERIYSEKDPEVKARRTAEWKKVREEYKVYMDGHLHYEFRQLARNMEELAEMLEELERTKVEEY